MMRNVDHLLVLFRDRMKASHKALLALEDIDDDCDDIGVSFVEVKLHAHYNSLSNYLNLKFKKCTPLFNETCKPSLTNVSITAG